MIPPELLEAGLQHFSRGIRPPRPRGLSVRAGLGQKCEALELINLIKHHRTPDDSMRSHMGKLGEDAPVACFVGVGQSAARHRAAKPQAIEFPGHGSEAGFDVPQALAVSQLREGHRQVLIPVRKLPRLRMIVVNGPRISETPGEGDGRSTLRKRTGRCASLIVEKLGRGAPAQFSAARSSNRFPLKFPPRHWIERVCWPPQSTLPDTSGCE